MTRKQDEYLSARFQAGRLAEHVAVDFWTFDHAEYSDFHMKQAHLAFETIADILGYTITRKEALKTTRKPDDFDMEARILRDAEVIAAADELAADHRQSRDEICELADYVLNREGAGLSEYEAKGIFADLQRARLRMDAALAAYSKAKETDQ